MLLEIGRADGTLDAQAVEEIAAAVAGAARGAQLRVDLGGLRVRERELLLLADALRATGRAVELRGLAAHQERWLQAGAPEAAVADAAAAARLAAGEPESLAAP